MRPLAQDTPLEVERIQLEILGRKSAGERLRIAAELSASVRALTLAGLREVRPGASEHELRMRLYATWLDRQQMIAAYGWDPEEHP